jgi:hypothetical protein
MLLQVLGLVLSAGLANAVPDKGSLTSLALAGVRLNPGVHLAEMELEAKLLKLHDMGKAKRVSEVQFLTVKNLFQPQQNPYRGQITQLVLCEKDLRPKEFDFAIKGRPVHAILGMANARRQIGACSRAEARFSSLYFNFISANGDLLDVRVFAPVKSAKRLQELAPWILINE